MTHYVILGNSAADLTFPFALSRPQGESKGFVSRTPTLRGLSSSIFRLPSSSLLA